VRIARHVSQSLALAVILLCAILGCVTGPSFQDYLEELRSVGGTSATECGVVGLEESRANALSCGQAALDEGAPFWMVVQVMGIDSKIFLGLAVDEHGRAWKITWDSDRSGGSAWITPRGMYKESCDIPLLADRPGEEPIQCRPNQLATPNSRLEWPWPSSSAIQRT
jgi:hypothetical protein